MILMAHMDGTQCEEVHLIYMERMEAFSIHVLEYHFDICLLRLGFLLLFSMVVVLFSTRVFPSMNPTSSLERPLGRVL